MNNTNEIKNKIIEYRINNCLTQEDFSNKTGISIFTISQIENGKTKKVSTKTLNKLKEYIDLKQ